MGKDHIILLLAGIAGYLLYQKYAKAAPSQTFTPTPAIDIKKPIQWIDDMNIELDNTRVYPQDDTMYAGLC